VRNAVRYFEDHDEFYWNVTGNDWSVPIDHVTALVSLPGEATGSLRAQAFTGIYGAVQRETISKLEGSKVSFETTNPPPMRGGMTIDVYIRREFSKNPALLPVPCGL
jgi:hypothetical protein